MVKTIKQNPKAETIIGTVVVVVVVVVVERKEPELQSPDSNCIVDRAWALLFFVIFATFFHFPVRGSNSRMSSKKVQSPAQETPPKYVFLEN